VTNVMRSDDTPPNCMDQAAMLANAPAVHQGDLVRVPQVLTEGGA
jgi:Asp-tRNA(Asn)/Glu-tRNA(Gln) amidotransferase C subunit